VLRKVIKSPVGSVAEEWNFQLPDVKIEKTFTDISSMELFGKFCSALRSGELPRSYRTSRPWTKLVRRILREIGVSLGYQVRDRDLVGEWLTIDQTWRIHDSSMIKTYLAMESENSSEIDDVIDDEVEKLLDIKSNLKLLIYYPKQRTQELHLRVLREKIGAGPLLPDERFITMMIDSDATAEDDYSKYTQLVVRGSEIAKNMRQKELGIETINAIR
jgi:hypothetical protein